ncbi:MAG: hypothetical protein WEE64_07750 [Dehalococcoidia bacterium]
MSYTDDDLDAYSYENADAYVHADQFSHSYHDGQSHRLSDQHCDEDEHEDRYVYSITDRNPNTHANTDTIRHADGNPCEGGLEGEGAGTEFREPGPDLQLRGHVYQWCNFSYSRCEADQPASIYGHVQLVVAAGNLRCRIAYRLLGPWSNQPGEQRIVFG